MLGELLVAALSFIGTCIGSWGGLKLMSYRIEQLEKRVDKHNSVIERVYRLEQNEAVIFEKLDVENHRISDLEEMSK